MCGHSSCRLCEQENLTRLGKLHVVISNIPVLDLGSKKTLRLFPRVEGVFYPFERICSRRLVLLRRGTKGGHFGATEGWL
jgi:hypothetical protein